MFDLLIRVIRNLFSKPYTKRYPKIKPKISKNSKGKPRFIKERCIGCRLCELNCPSECITVYPKGKRIVIDTSKCVYCGTCEFVCPKNAIEFIPDYENATNDKKSLKVQ